MRNHLILPLGLALATAGCAAGPDYTSPGSPALGIPAHYHQQEGVPVSDEALASWWTRFDDPVLNTIVEQAIDANTDIAQATASPRQARQALVQSRADSLPSVTGSDNDGTPSDDLTAKNM